MVLLLEGKDEDVKQFTSQRRFTKLAQQQDSNGHTALMLASRDGNVSMVRQLLSDFQSKSNAAKSSKRKLGPTEPVTAILTEQQDSHGQTSLLLAAMFDQVAVLQELVAANANVNATAVDGRAPLQWAARCGAAAALKKIAITAIIF